MNATDFDVLKLLSNFAFSQRELSRNLNVSLGKVNSSIKRLRKNLYIDERNKVRKAGKKYLDGHTPQKAIILAAGYGFRMIPINNSINKALIEVKDEVIIERLIRQLHAVNVTDITIIVGYMKEQFDYLVDEYSVKLIVNMEYASTNTLVSLYKARNVIENTYIIHCDLYFAENPFSKYELYSWYLLSDEIQKDSFFKATSDKHIAYTNKDGSRMIGLAYVANDLSETIKLQLEKMYSENLHKYWEEALVINRKIEIMPKFIDTKNVIEFNTYKDLLMFDCNSPILNLEIFKIIRDVLSVSQEEVIHIEPLKFGMTNRSFYFETLNGKYIMRIPGEGTDRLINRKEEGDVYRTIQPLHISDNVLYFNSDNGYKLTQYINNARNSSSDNVDDIKKCMHFLRTFHDSKLKVDHFFDVFSKIDYFESLWNKNKSIYRDYDKTKKNIMKLQSYIESIDKVICLTHIDAVPDNFVFYEDEGVEKIRLIDWEYAGMQDPHIDIAMYAIYACYEKQQIDDLISYYFTEGADQETIYKIYAYIACCGLLWSNWCEFKLQQGVEFGEYSIKQYRYAKDYYKLVSDYLGGV
ncbi:MULTISPECIES: phosphocholine cytidylyltransferase/choline kinase family protein [unclassified Breznakia]|uniref:phosphocholine cytidylyltransferase/choline kinase family protein n=1 Tax=unclassified Breznakia TaxID=2623764 RepID=UPI002476A1F8|nr:MULTISPECIES: phosphocholine cytidylyltransferase/choline kinase family protein [unclassified Breznakia]MDH6366300.1 CTP:phosphocholine cytidylyltransferase-like protein/thiamine kinase-like enzyme [Breznakia sp. PH1-1]MDH6403393.1 CTP:phosphocholine cytidylyltransferase-like protein/thiamine kinase-like enzyme [Breznakia sp. PF1-11]MDH6411102.1 CTP:phosphocholine cytidylyltransferase-like protein/thiamine kinase-like enzyme [Breznakia sp. PFB1-11]MDH6413466.1 CTP:phosphocholine cytidylyltra